MNDKITSSRGAFAKTMGKTMAIRGVSIKSGDQTIARMIVNLNTGEITFENIEGEFSITKDTIEFLNLKTASLSITF